METEFDDNSKLNSQVPESPIKAPTIAPKFIHSLNYSYKYRKVVGNFENEGIYRALECNFTGLWQNFSAP